MINPSLTASIFAASILLLSPAARAIDTTDLPALPASQQQAIWQVKDVDLGTCGTAFVIGYDTRGNYLALTNDHACMGSEPQLVYRDGTIVTDVEVVERSIIKDLALLRFRCDKKITPLELAPYGFRPKAKAPLLAAGAASDRLCLHTGLYRDNSREYSRSLAACYSAVDGYVRPGFSGSPMVVVDQATGAPVVVGCVAVTIGDLAFAGPCIAEIYRFLEESQAECGRIALGSARRGLPDTQQRVAASRTTQFSDRGARVVVNAGNVVISNTADFGEGVASQTTVDITADGGVHITQSVNGETRSYFIPQNPSR